MKLLPKDMLRIPERHAFAYGCRNVVYLAGYVYDIEPRRIRLMLTNNKNLLLPVLLTPTTQPPRSFTKHSQIKITATIRGIKLPDGTRTIGIYARGYEVPNILELPLRSAMDKLVPKEAEEITDFKPYGAGYRASASCNEVHVAGLVLGVQLERESQFKKPEGEGEEGNGLVNGKVTILIRQNENTDQAIPVTYYGRYASTILDRVKVGSPISVKGYYRVRPVVTGEVDPNGLAIVKIEPYLHVELPQNCEKQHIKWIEDAKLWPRWAVDFAESTNKRSSRAAPKKATDPAAAESAAAAAAPAAPAAAAAIASVDDMLS